MDARTKHVLKFIHSRDQALQPYRDWARSDPDTVYRIASHWAEMAGKQDTPAEQVLFDCAAIFLSELLVAEMQAAGELPSEAHA